VLQCLDFSQATPIDRERLQLYQHSQGLETAEDTLEQDGQDPFWDQQHGRACSSEDVPRYASEEDEPLVQQLDTAWDLTRGNAVRREELLAYVTRWNHSILHGDDYGDFSEGGNNIQSQQHHPRPSEDRQLIRGHPADEHGAVSSQSDRVQEDVGDAATASFHQPQGSGQTSQVYAGADGATGAEQTQRTSSAQQLHQTGGANQTGGIPPDCATTAEDLGILYTPCGPMEVQSNSSARPEPSCQTTSAAAEDSSRPGHEVSAVKVTTLAACVQHLNKSHFHCIM
jgi:hypothetical protein